MNPNATTIHYPSPTLQSPEPQSSSCNLQSGNLHSRGLALFSILIELAEILLIYVVEILAALSASKFFPLFGKAIGCLASLGRLRLALARAPQRFTARQMLRLARASEKIRLLTGQAFDFSPWLSLTPEQLDQLDPKSSPSQSPSQSSGIPQSAIRNPKSAINSVPSVPSTPPVAPTPAIREAAALTLTPTPGATLARICEDLVELASELGLAHYGATGFLPPPELHGQLGISPELSRLLTPTQSPSPSPSQSPSVHHVHGVINVQIVQYAHSVQSIPPVQSEIPVPQSPAQSSYIPHSISPALQRQLTHVATPIRAPD